MPERIRNLGAKFGLSALCCKIRYSQYFIKTHHCRKITTGARWQYILLILKSKNYINAFFVPDF